MNSSHVFSGADLVFFPLLQRGIEGDFATSAIATVAKSPLTPLYKRGEEIYRAFGT
jgi:kynureninase